MGDDSKVTNVIIPHEASGKYFSIYLDHEVRRMEEDSVYRNQLLEKYDALYRHNLISGFNYDELPMSHANTDTGSQDSMLPVSSQNNIVSDSVAEPSNLENVVLQKTHLWSTNETLALIRSMESHLEEAKHPKKRKHVFDNISNDLLSLGFSIASHHCQSKWKNLVRSYTTGKDVKNKTGRGPSRFQFFTEMDEVLGDRPTNKCTHSMESSVDISEMTTEVATPIDVSDVEPSPVPPPTVISQKEKSKKRKASTLELKEENRNKRHKERLEIEREKIKLEREKLALLKEYIELKKKRTVM